MRSLKGVIDKEVSFSTFDEGVDRRYCFRFSIPLLKKFLNEIRRRSFITNFYTSLLDEFHECL
jgi:hypothetical protein